MLDLSLEMKNKFHFFPLFHLPFSIPHLPFSSAKALLPANIALKGSKDVQYLAIALNKTYTSHQTRSSQSSFTLHTQIYITGICIRADILWAYVYAQRYIMGRYITSSDIFNAPEVGSSLTTWLYLTLFIYYSLHFAIPLYIREL